MICWSTCQSKNELRKCFALESGSWLNEIDAKTRIEMKSSYSEILTVSPKCKSNQIKIDVFIYPVWLNCFSFLRWWRCVYQAKLMQTVSLARKADNWTTFSKNRSPPIWTKQSRHRLTLPINAARHPCKATFSFWYVILV